MRSYGQDFGRPHLGTDGKPLPIPEQEREPDPLRQLGNRLAGRIGQAKIPAGPAADAKEGEADRMAEQAGPPAPAASGDETAVPAPPIVEEALRSPGRPLDARTRAFMEERFAFDFGDVRIHTDDRAHESAVAVRALAYTVGRDIVFQRGRYDPGSGPGRRLLAHELAHVVQDRASTAGMLRRVDDDTVSPEDLEIALGDPLTPEEMYTTMTSQTVFREGQRGADGRIMRRSDDTRAVIQLIDGDGRRVQVVMGSQSGGLHAEEHGLRRLRRLIEPDRRLLSVYGSRFGADAAEAMRQRAAGMRERLTGGRLVVVANQFVCEDRCQQALRQFADEFHLETVSAHVFESEDRRPRATFDSQPHPSSLDRTRRRIDTEVYHQPGRRRMRAIARGAGGIATLLGIIFADLSVTRYAEAAEAIRARQRHEGGSGGRTLPSDGIDLYNLQSHVERIFGGHEPMEVGVGQRNALQIATEAWVRRDYVQGGGTWWNYFETELERATRDSDMDTLGSTLVFWLQGTGIDLGTLGPFGRLGTGERGNLQRIADAQALVDSLLVQEDAYLERAAAADQAAEAGASVLEEQMAGYGVLMEDAITIHDSLADIGNRYRGYVGCLRAVRTALEAASLIDQDRWRRLQQAIAAAGARPGTPP